MSSLIISLRGRVVRIVRLHEGMNYVGRNPQCNLVLDLPSISNFHLALNTRDAIAVLRDLDSTNGTSVNGEAVSATPLAHGDLIRVSDYELQFVQKNLFGAEELAASPAFASPQLPTSAPTVPGALEQVPVPRSAQGNRVGGAFGATWLGDAVAFSLPARGREIPAMITADALQSQFSVPVYGPDGPTLAVQAYEENHVAINVVAWKRFSETEREPIRIRAADFRM